MPKKARWIGGLVIALALAGGLLFAGRIAFSKSLESGIRALREGDAAGAERLLRYAVLLGSNSGAAHAALGESIFTQRDRARYGEALRHLERAVALGRDNHDIRYFRGSIFFEWRDYRRAKREFEAALRLDPRGRYRGAIYYRLTVIALPSTPGGVPDIGLASRYARLLVSAFPNDADGWRLLAATLTEAKQYGEALKAIDRALELDPKDCRSHNNKADLANKLADYTGALAHASQAIALGSAATGEWNRRCVGMSYITRGEAREYRREFSLAIADYEQALAILNENAEWSVLASFARERLSKLRRAGF